MATKTQTETISEPTLSFVSVGATLPKSDSSLSTNSSLDSTENLLGFSPNSYRPIIEREAQEDLINRNMAAEARDVGGATQQNIDHVQTVRNLKAALTSPEIIQVLKSALCGVEEFKENHFNPLQKRVCELESKIETLEKDKSEIKERLTKLENAGTITDTSNPRGSPQSTNKINNLIIYGLNGQAGNENSENTTELVNDLCKAIGITGINIEATRIGKKDKKVRPILVEFSTVWDKRKVYAARFSLKQHGFDGVFINEDLTKDQLKVFYHARIAKKDRMIENTWTSGGMVFISKLNKSGEQISKPVPNIGVLQALLPNLVIETKTTTTTTKTRGQENTEPQEGNQSQTSDKPLPQQRRRSPSPKSNHPNQDSNAHREQQPEAEASQSTAPTSQPRRSPRDPKPRTRKY